MSQIRAAQLIFTRVEPDYSPQYKSGYQTVYRSASLADSDVAFIEKRIQCFQPIEENAIRYQFFTLANRAIVLTHTTGIRTHPEINDRTRREGVFIAHCLILSRHDFEQANSNPFVIFDRFTFLADSEEMVNQLGDPKERLPDKEITVRRTDGYSASDWTGSEAQKLVALAMQADEILKKRRAVHLIGNATEIKEALQITFRLLPFHNRLLCTFDTIADNCMIQQGAYWAIGLYRQGSTGAFAEINARGRTLKSVIQPKFDEKNLYESWLKTFGPRSDLATALQYAETFQQLAGALSTHNAISFDDLDADACVAFVDFYAEHVTHAYVTKTEKIVGENVARELFGFLQQTLSPADVLQDTLTLVDSKRLSARVLDWLVLNVPDLGEGEWRKLENLARQGENARLLFLSATCGKKVNIKARDEALLRFTPEDFEFALKFLMNPIAPADLVTPFYLDQLFHDKRLDGMSPTQAVELMEALLKCDAVAHLDTLAPLIPDLDNVQLHKIEQQVQKKTGIGDRFVRAVRARRNELGAPPSLLGFLKI